MGSLKARSLAWVLVALVGCSVLVRLTREEPVVSPERSTNSATEGGVFGRVPAILARVLFGRQEQATAPEPNTDEKLVLDPPPGCACSKVFERQLARSCGFSAPILSTEKKNGETVGWRVTRDEGSNIWLELGFQKGDLITGIDRERFDISKSQRIFRRDLILKHRLEFQIERDGKAQTLIATLLDDGTFKTQVLKLDSLTTILDRPADFCGKGFTAKPMLENGEVVGFHLNLTNTKHPLYQMGLRDQDLLLSLNGTSLNEPESLSNIFRILRNNSNLEFEIIRNGRPQTIIPQFGK